jgi:apolipoprotein N-acyltransferase
LAENNTTLTARDAAVSLVAGAATTLSFAPLHWWPVPFFTLAVLYLLSQGKRTTHAAVLGFLFGLGWFASGVSWVYVSMHDVGGMPMWLAALATLLFSAYLALYPALATACTAALSSRTAMLEHTRLAWPTWLVFPAAWCVSEWLRGTVFTGFPWIAIGYAHTDGPLAGYAPLIGVYGLCFLSAAVAVCVATLLKQLFAAQPTADSYSAAPTPSAITPRSPLVGHLGPVTWAVGGIILVFGAGLGLKPIAWTQASGAPVSVALAQGNIPQSMKFEPGRFESTLLTYLRMTENTRAQLVVLPETAMPRMFDEIPTEYFVALARASYKRGANVIVGVPVRMTRTVYFNSAISFGTDKSARYDKQHLVPFGEFIPFGFRWFVEAMNIPLGDFSRGTTVKPMRLGAQQVAINICYEDLFGEEIIRALPEATLLVNISNIAWFGDSLAPHQHLQISRMRALETGRPVLRATNTGATAVIASDGTVTAALKFFTEGVLEAEVTGRTGMTPYASTGNMPVLTSAWGLLLLFAWRVRRARARTPT